MLHSQKYNMLAHLFEIQGEYEVIGYYPYTSVVTLRIFQSKHWNEDTTEEGVYAQKLFDKYMKEAENLDCLRDNKVVLELRRKIKDEKSSFRKESSIFIGRYDGIVSIGFGVCVYDSRDAKRIKNVKVRDKETGHYMLVCD